MPYVDCARCGRIAFTAAYWSSLEYCPHCGTVLPRPRSAIRSLRDHRGLSGHTSGDWPHTDAHGEAPDERG